MATHAPKPLAERIRRARAGIAEAERDLAAAQERRDFREVARLERGLVNRHAYLAELVASLRGPAPR